MRKTLSKSGNYGNLFLLLVSLLFIALPGELPAAAKGKDDVRSADLMEGAKKEGKLIVYGGGSAETYNTIMRQGLKLFPFNPEWGADYARYEEEYRNIFLKKQR